jgi:ankyrin repeat protein
MKCVTFAVMAAACLSALMIAGSTAAQPPGGAPPGPPVDFNTNVRPIFVNRCVSCHGAAVQRGGLRLDDRDAALKGAASGPVIVPGHSDKSKLYQMVASKKMPLDDELSVLELQALKDWIDGGAQWPAKRVIPNMAVDPKVDAFRLALRNQDKKAIATLLADPALAKARGVNGTTALHLVAVFGDAAQAKALLDKGADVNAADQDGITPLIWAVRDDAIAGLLIDRGANVNAVSDGGIDALTAASGRATGAAVIRRLLDKGAKPAMPQQMQTAAALGFTSNLDGIKLLYPKVLDVNGPQGNATAAIVTNTQCMACLDYLISQGAKGKTLNDALVFAANSGNAAMVKRLLDLGATLDGKGTQDATALIAAAITDREPAEKLRLLLAAGANPNVPDAHGRTPLMYAKIYHPDLAPMLVAKGAK